MKLFRYHRQRGEHVPEEPTNAGSNLFAWADDPAANPIAPEDSDLTAIVDAYSRVQVALASEQSTMDRTRKNELWEEIMRNSPSTTSTAPISPLNDRHVGSAPSRAPGSALARSRGTSHPRVPARHQGTWLIVLNAGLFAVLLLGITGVVWNRDFFDLGGGGRGSGGDTRPQLAMSGMGETPNSTPATFASANPFDYIDTKCNAAPRSKDEIATLLRSDKQWPERKYLPVTKADTQTAQQVSAAAAQYFACTNAGRSKDMRSERMIFQDDANIYYRQSSGYEQSLTTRREAFDELSSAFAQNLNIYLNFGPWSDATLQEGSELVRPEDVLVMADGRLGAPVTSLSNRPETPPASIESQISRGNSFVIFKKEDGRWLLDEWINTCSQNCSYADPLPVPGSTPAASPIATSVGFVNSRESRS